MVTNKKITGMNNGSRRAFTYKALNKLIQGSAADMTKKAMLDCIKKVLHLIYRYMMNLIYLLESECTSCKNKRLLWKHAVELKIPNKVDYESGPNWGEIK